MHSCSLSPVLITKVVILLRQLKRIISGDPLEMCCTYASRCLRWSTYERRAAGNLLTAVPEVGRAEMTFVGESSAYEGISYGRFLQVRVCFVYSFIVLIGVDWSADEDSSMLLSVCGCVFDWWTNLLSSGYAQKKLRDRRASVSVEGIYLETLFRWYTELVGFLRWHYLYSVDLVCCAAWSCSVPTENDCKVYERCSHFHFGGAGQTVGSLFTLGCVSVFAFDIYLTIRWRMLRSGGTTIVAF